MSLIVTVRTGEGVVMASDSRMTTNLRRVDGTYQHDVVAAHFSDTTYKTFMLGNRFGVSTCGDAMVKGRAVAGWMQDFEAQNVDNKCSLDECAQKLATFFSGIRPSGELIFHVGGYQSVDGTMRPTVYHLVINSQGQISLSHPETGYGARWDGQQETLTRLIKGCYIVDASKSVPLGDVTTTLPEKEGKVVSILHKDMLGIPMNTLYYQESSIDFSSFTLQDAVDFCMYAIRTTIGTIRFKSEPVTVAEPIDVLVITPEKASWLAHKELHI